MPTLILEDMDLEFSESKERGLDPSQASSSDKRARKTSSPFSAEGSRGEDAVLPACYRPAERPSFNSANGP